jgi:hypothetical protein
MYNRHTAIDVSLSSPHGTGATGTAGNPYYWKASFDINLPSEIEKVSGLNHYVPNNRFIHTELAPSDTIGGSICLSDRTYQRTQTPYWYCKRNTAHHIKVSHQ